MDRNLLLALALSFLVLTLWSNWQRDRLEKAQPVATEQVEERAENDEFETQEKQLTDPAVLLPERIEPSSAPEVLHPEKQFVVDTPLYQAELTSLGAGITRWTLKTYFDRLVNPPEAVELSTTDNGRFPGFITPLRELGIGDLSISTFKLVEQAEHQLVFELEKKGVRVRKTYVFNPDNYALSLAVEVENLGKTEVSTSFEVLWPAMENTKADFSDHALVAMMDGDVERQPFTSVGTDGLMNSLFGPELPLEGNVDWAGVESRYFVVSIASERPRDATADFRSVRVGQLAYASLAQAPTRLGTGQQAKVEYEIYAGPKEEERLLAFGNGAERAINYGYSWVAPLARFFGWLLRLLYSLIPNYGVAIILITLLMRVVTIPLMSKQMQSMKKMGELAPKMKELQEKYAGDRQKLAEAQMQLYRSTGVNPLGGCLPILLQMPVFIGLYFALQSSIELRQAPFMLWIDDLSQPEALFTIPGLGIPFRLLPVVMGLSMILQQKLTPTSATMDPAQAKMMLWMMPIMFTVLFYGFPSGLVLYWWISNILGIAHQYWVNRSKN